jgi:hypothetical protein
LTVLLGCDERQRRGKRFDTFDNGWPIQLDGLISTDTRSDQITYAYGSFLKTDALFTQCNGPTPPPTAVCQIGVMDRIFKPVEPLQLQLTLVGKF